MPNEDLGRPSCSVPSETPQTTSLSKTDFLVASEEVAQAAAALWCGLFRCMRRVGRAPAFWPTPREVQLHMQVQKEKTRLLLQPTEPPFSGVEDETPAQTQPGPPLHARCEHDEATTLPRLPLSSRRFPLLTALMRSWAGAAEGVDEASGELQGEDSEAARQVWAEAAAACCAVGQWNDLPEVLDAASQASAADAGPCSVWQPSRETTLATTPAVQVRKRKAPLMPASLLLTPSLSGGDSFQSLFLLQHSRILMLLRRLARTDRPNDEPTGGMDSSGVFCCDLSSAISAALDGLVRPLSAALKESQTRAEAHLRRLHVLSDLQVGGGALREDTQVSRGADCGDAGSRLCASCEWLLGSADHLQ